MYASVWWRCWRIRCIDDELKPIHQIKRKHFGIDFNRGRRRRNQRQISNMNMRCLSHRLGASRYVVHVYLEKKPNSYFFGFDDEKWFLGTSQNVNTTSKYFCNIGTWEAYTSLDQLNHSSELLLIVFCGKPVSHMLHAANSADWFDSFESTLGVRF